MRIIAYYLPQFHIIEENNLWWGDGFTEWTNVRKARPLFYGHHQPVEPGELGYYNLLDSDIRERQAVLAHEAGIEGFCYWHYWFAGKRLLEKPLQQVLKSGTPDFPFCIGWANESWMAKTWNKQSEGSNRLLIEQTYPEQDAERHFASILPILQDKRYICVNDKPLVVIYRPLDIPSDHYMNIWRSLAKKNGLKGLYCVGHALFRDQIDSILKLGYDAVNYVPLGDIKRSLYLAVRHPVSFLRFMMGYRPLVYPYHDALSILTDRCGSREDVIPTLLPRWDHTPRSGKNGFLLYNATAELFRKQVEEVRTMVSSKPAEKQLVFLKSWNEWGEGNYIEPDKESGNEFLEQLK